MSTMANFTSSHLTVHIRRLSAEGSVLYVRIDSSDIARLGLRHGQAIEIDLGRDRVSGIVKTSGGSPWLAPRSGSSNVSITAALRRNGFEHRMDVPASVRKLTADGDPLSAAGSLVRSQTPPSSIASHSGYATPRFSRDWTECVRQYNRGSYRGRHNTELDREAYSRFAKGLSWDMAELITQITFVGKEYGGAQERFGDIRTEAGLIAANIHPILEQWSKAVAEAKPLVEGIPRQATLEYLFSPFRGTKQWPVWASKTLHFLRPDVFPILDSNAKKPLGLRNLVNSSFGYRQFCSTFRDFLLANSEKLATARTADSGESPTDLKLLDKILYQLGILMN
jgi:hypothetical protein